LDSTGWSNPADDSPSLDDLPRWNGYGSPRKATGWS